MKICSYFEAERLIGENDRLKAKIKNLEDGIEGILNQKDLISFAIQKQLEELVGKEKP